MSKNKKNKKGFTLVEVIIVLAIIAIIAAIAIPSLTKVRQESKIKADTQSIESLVRTVNMLITDETIEFNNSAITIRIKGNTANKIIVKGAVDVGTNTPIANELAAYLIDVEMPQEEGKEDYFITINADGSVKGQTLDTKAEDPVSVE